MNDLVCPYCFSELCTQDESQDLVLGVVNSCFKRNDHFYGKNIYKGKLVRVKSTIYEGNVIYNILVDINCNNTSVWTGNSYFPDRIIIDNLVAKLDGSREQVLNKIKTMLVMA